MTLNISKVSLFIPVSIMISFGVIAHSGICALFNYNNSLIVEDFLSLQALKAAQLAWDVSNWGRVCVPRANDSSR